MNELELYSSRRKTARIAGVFYLVLALAMFPDLVRKSLVVAGDAATTGRNILANVFLFRTSMVVDLITEIAFLLLALCLYSLLKDVRREIAWTMVAMVIVAVTMAMYSTSKELTALTLLQGNDLTQAMLFLELYKNERMIATIFFGLWLLPLGWLFFQSGFMPKWLGILLMLGCFGYLTHALAGLLMPEWRTWTVQGVMLPAVAELASVFWLLVFGVNRPAEQKSSLVTA